MQNKNGEEDFAAPVDGVIKSIRSLEISNTPVFHYF